MGVRVPFNSMSYFVSNPSQNRKLMVIVIT